MCESVWECVSVRVWERQSTNLFLPNGKSFNDKQCLCYSKQIYIYIYINDNTIINWPITMRYYFICIYDILLLLLLLLLKLRVCSFFFIFYIAHFRHKSETWTWLRNYSISVCVCVCVCVCLVNSMTY